MDYKSSKKKLLVCSWEYPGYNSRRGSALARRVGQIADGFIKKEWEVLVIHRDNIGEVPNGKEYVRSWEKGVLRYSFSGSDSVPAGKSPFPIFRKIATLYYALKYGDRSGLWAKVTARRFLEIHPSYHPDLIIGFFTPRGPLLLAHMLSSKFKCPWFADLQDPITNGTNRYTRPLVIRWMRNLLKSPKKIIHVSPEWSEQDSLLTGRKIHIVRHAIPRTKTSEIDALENKENVFNLLYAGRLDPHLQSPEFLVSAAEEMNSQKNTRIIINLCGHEWVKNDFSRYVKHNNDFIHYKGWLSEDEMLSQVQQSNALLLISSSKNYSGFVPSKLYEYMSYGKPVLIAGFENGGIRSLLKEWGHPDVICDTKEKITEAISRALEGSFDRMLMADKCQNKLLYEDNLADKYLSLYINLREEPQGEKG